MKIKGFLDPRYEPPAPFLSATVFSKDLGLRHVGRVIDLANWIDELTGNRDGIIFTPKRDWDKVVRRRASMEKIGKILGYEPKMGIKEGLERTMDWFLHNRGKIEESAIF
jgi:nucleoside-diphosphate-sugar epimerase